MSAKVKAEFFEVLRHVPHSYTILPDIKLAWRWGNAVTSLLVTQRGFLLGIPLAVLVFVQWWRSLYDTGTRGHGDAETSTRKRPPKTKRKVIERDLRVPVSPRPRVFLSPRLRVSAPMIAAGVIAGSLPLIHAHSFIAVIMVAAFLVPWIYRRAWIAYGVAALVALAIYVGAIRPGSADCHSLKVAFGGLIVAVATSLFGLLPKEPSSLAAFLLWR